MFVDASELTAILADEGELRSFGVDEEDDLVLTLAAIRRLGTIGAIEAHCDGAERQPAPLVLADGPQALA